MAIMEKQREKNDAISKADDGMISALEYDLDVKIECACNLNG